MYYNLRSRSVDVLVGIYIIFHAPAYRVRGLNQIYFSERYIMIGSNNHDNILVLNESYYIQVFQFSVTLVTLSRY